MTPVGSNLRVSSVDLAVTPNPCSHRRQPDSSCIGTHVGVCEEDPTDERYIRHVINHHPLMFWRIFRDPSKVGFHHMVAVQER
jgi:hypothetical protein